MKKVVFLSVLLHISCCRQSGVAELNDNDFPTSKKYYDAYNDRATVKKLQQNVINLGDKEAFKKLKEIYFLSEHENDFLFYATVMAEKYNDSGAHYILYKTLYFYENQKNTNQLAIYHLLRSYELGNKGALEELHTFFPEDKIPPSGHYWDEIH